MTLKNNIIEELDLIEKEFDVTVFYACESGSRAWGFESKDSDYDVRFLYFHKLDWYLSVENKRDVIEKPVSNILDISGWDLKKALGLMRKSNPPLLEWLQSPIIYKNDEHITNQIKSVLPDYYSNRNCFYHYLHMAEGNFRDYLKGENVLLKKYFYVLRPIFACRYIEFFDKPVPMEFDKLVKETLTDIKLTRKINDLTERKKSGDELDYSPRIPEISDFIKSELERLSEKNIEKIKYKNFDELNDLFRRIVKNSEY